jgi:hypothetical protein
MEGEEQITSYKKQRYLETNRLTSKKQLYTDAQTQINIGTEREINRDETGKETERQIRENTIVIAYRELSICQLK